MKLNQLHVFLGELDLLECSLSKNEGGVVRQYSYYYSVHYLLLEISTPRFYRLIIRLLLDRH